MWWWWCVTFACATPTQWADISKTSQHVWETKSPSSESRPSLCSPTYCRYSYKPVIRPYKLLFFYLAVSDSLNILHCDVLLFNRRNMSNGKVHCFSASLWHLWTQILPLQSEKYSLTKKSLLHSSFFCHLIYCFVLFLLFSLCEYCLVDLLLKKSPLMFSQHFIECIFHFNSYEKHKKYNKFPQTERYILKLYIIWTWKKTMFNFLSIYGRKCWGWMQWVLKMCLYVFWQWENQVFSKRKAESRQTLQDLQVPIEKLYRWAALQHHKQNLPGHSWWELFVIDCFLWCLYRF